jgi:hypothetical protein
MKTFLAALIVVAVLFGFGGWAFEDAGIGIAAAQTGPPPDCSNGDCPPPPPDCSNGDCPPPPPDCSNGDCPPPEPGESCCCVGDNQPGDIRVCCCRSGTLDTMTCRQSLVLDYGYPDNWHQTLAEVTLDGRRPRSCNALLENYCYPPVEEVCAQKKGKGCPKVVEALCNVLDRVCRFRFCGPEWFPYDEPAPDLAGCEWWDQIYRCRFR